MIHIRAGKETDVPYVVSTWVDSYASTPWAADIRKVWQLGLYTVHDRGDLAKSDPYQVLHRRFVVRLLARTGVEVRVAAWDEDPNVIAGWCCVEPDAVHYVYVRNKFRRDGVARRLLGPELESKSARRYSHLPAPAADLAPSKLPIPEGWTYDWTLALPEGARVERRRAG